MMYLNLMMYGDHLETELDLKRGRKADYFEVPQGHPCRSKHIDLPSPGSLSPGQPVLAKGQASQEAWEFSVEVLWKQQFARLISFGA